MTPAAVYVYDWDDERYRRCGTWPRVPYEQGWCTQGSIHVKVYISRSPEPRAAVQWRDEVRVMIDIDLPEQQAWRPVLDPPPTCLTLEGAE